MTQIPALLLAEETKRRNAREQVEAAVKAIKQFGSLAGMSDRSMFEFSALVGFIEKEINRERKNKTEMGRCSEEWPV